MKQYAGLKACAVLAALVILGVAGVAEADIVVYVKKENRVVPLKVTKYSDYGRVMYVYPPSGASKAIPKSKICAIVNDSEKGYVHILNPCAFTPKQLTKIQKVRENIRRRSEAISRRSEAISQAKKERRMAQDAEIRAQRERLRKTWRPARKAGMDKTWFAAELCGDSDAKMQRALRLAKNKPANQRDVERALAHAKYSAENTKRALKFAENKRVTNVRAANKAFRLAVKSQEETEKLVKLAQNKQADVDEANEAHRVAVKAQKKCRREMKIAEAEEPDVYLVWITAYNRKEQWVTEAPEKEWVAEVRKRMKGQN